MAVYCKHENTKCAVHWKQTKATSQRQEHVHRQVTKRRSNDIRKRPKRSTESGERLACIDPNRRTIKLLKQRKDDVVTYQFVGLPNTHQKLNFSRRHSDTHWREHAADKLFQYSHMRRWPDQVNQYSRTSNLHMKLTHLKTIHGHNQMCKRRNRAAVTASPRKAAALLF